MFKRFFILLIAICAMFSLQAETDSAIGQVITVKKKVEAQRQESVIPLKRKSTLQQKDIVNTGEEARSQFRLKDGTLFTLGENSSLVIDTYLYSEEAQPSASFELVKGVFRAITGKITKMKDPSFNVKTPLGSIGIRGTDFWGGYLKPDQIDILFIDGEHPISIENEYGKVELLQPGQGTTIMPGKAPSKPKVWPKSKVDWAVSTITIDE
ncbi:FecR family protein [Alteromonas sp. a30]|uniref:FecR family protein n=1 Tax=Alteromonas sp. a30 TaxID=2730917 RepID=UPI00227EEE9B|nr:FecR family protein [Alteromonas sp. a30]MCY7294572.1 FecR domain-containing protein [Alteromonas sp. a30]